jgi:uncharacterized membrane protein
MWYDTSSQLARSRIIPSVMKRFDGAGFSMSGTQAVLNSIASNCMVDEGQVVNAAEIFWTPGDPKEALTSTDLIVDFPELVTL